MKKTFIALLVLLLIITVWLLSASKSIQNTKIEKSDHVTVEKQTSPSTAVVVTKDLVPEKLYLKSPGISVFPVKIIQGEPFLISVDIGSGTSTIKNITFDGKKVGFLEYEKKVTAISGIDLSGKVGTFKVIANFTNGSSTEAKVVVSLRKKVEAPLGIPDSLGGNTKASQDKLVASLVTEKAALTSFPSATTAYWSEKFSWPVEKITVTDPYGYFRQTGAYSISHKGTDFEAKVGTDVFAMNEGVVQVSQDYSIYGKTIIIDHGLGLKTLYMHLSKSLVKVGDRVNKGQKIALSGATGYAEGPHLHISVWINNVSVDPMKFMDLFK
ncbi:MAG: M23 family metallopeptidase [Candidatus Taylorbacteria bacterium]|nr:M23 family metallopeptidase [Candidatus Taylorbacteria bacterium]